MRRYLPIPALLLTCLIVVATLGLPSATAKDGKVKRKRDVERYPGSFRIAVEEAIKEGVVRLKQLQHEDGYFGSGQGAQALGHTALPTLTLLKAGVSPEDEAIQRAFKSMRKLPLERTYSVACYLMAIHARYAPKLDTFDTDVGKMRAKRAQPERVLARLSPIDRKALKDGTAFLLRAQNARGLWSYTDPADAKARGYDLSNVQYALLGLRAATDSGIKVPSSAWLAALQGVLDTQDRNGSKVKLTFDEVRGKYIIRRSESAEVRPFRYRDGKKNGPAGELTVATSPATGSMTAAGVACVAICREGLWRTRKFRAADRRKAQLSIRDGIAWLHQNFSVTTNPGHPNKAHHLYYLYGLERMGMLTDRRFIGTHDWYKEGADLLLTTQDAFRGGWGNHVATSFGVLFLKRATRGPAVQVTGG